jgi:hypothetical protein
VKYTVIWSDAAIQELAAIWLQVRDRTAITRTAHQIELTLSRDAQHVGEQRLGNQRITHVDPLGLRFDVIVDDLTVVIGAVWLTRSV